MIPEKVTAVYEQNTDACQDFDIQQLTIETDDAGGGKFVRFFTGEYGWSFDNVNEIIDIFNDFLARAGVQDNSDNRNSMDWKNS